MVKAAHHVDDELTLQRYTPASRRLECEERIWNNVVGQNRGGVADLIREQSDSIRVAICDDPQGRTPGKMEGVSLYRYQLRRMTALGPIWVFDTDRGWVETRDPADVDRLYAAAVPRALTNYTPEFGLELGITGDYQSPERQLPATPGYKPLVLLR
jgi:hypothetical protein